LEKSEAVAAQIQQEDELSLEGDSFVFRIVLEEEEKREKKKKTSFLRDVLLSAINRAQHFSPSMEVLFDVASSVTTSWEQNCRGLVPACDLADIHAWVDERLAEENARCCQQRVGVLLALLRCMGRDTREGEGGGGKPKEGGTTADRAITFPSFVQGSNRWTEELQVVEIGRDSVDVRRVKSKSQQTITLTRFDRFIPVNCYLQANEKLGSPEIRVMHDEDSDLRHCCLC
jgi:hypothetical protein